MKNQVEGKTWTLPLAKGDGVIDVGAAYINDWNKTRDFTSPKYGSDLVSQNTNGNDTLQDPGGAVSTSVSEELRLSLQELEYTQHDSAEGNRKNFSFIVLHGMA